MYILFLQKACTEGLPPLRMVRPAPHVETSKSASKGLAGALRAVLICEHAPYVHAALAMSSICHSM